MNFFEFVLFIFVFVVIVVIFRAWNSVRMEPEDEHEQLMGECKGRRKNSGE